ncbi:MAG: hypothetical protein Nk1A_7340 [Endomicrobiia bacterium]|nr:MAG: hypothetical protein Nk1A_7340 [Endomicrobiia bacterium]
MRRGGKNFMTTTTLALWLVNSFLFGHFFGTTIFTLFNCGANPIRILLGS